MVRLVPRDRRRGDDPKMKKTSLFIIVAALICAAEMQAQTNAPSAPSAEVVTAASAAPVVTAAAPQTTATTNVPAKKAAVKKAKPKAAPKIEWANAPEDYRTKNGNPVKVPYIVQKDGKHLAFKRWGAWQIATNPEERRRAMADAKVAQEDKEDGKTPAPAAKQVAAKKA
jgi:hypothetical protein